jgi:hypothetical protein
VIGKHKRRAKGRISGVTSTCANRCRPASSDDHVRFRAALCHVKGHCQGPFVRVLGLTRVVKFEYRHYGSFYRQACKDRLWRPRYHHGGGTPVIAAKDAL